MTNETSHCLYPKSKVNDERKEDMQKVIKALKEV